MIDAIERIFGKVKRCKSDDTSCVECGDASSAYAVYILDRGWLCGDCNHNINEAYGAWHGSRGGAKKLRKAAKAHIGLTQGELF